MAAVPIVNPMALKASRREIFFFMVSFVDFS